MPKGLVTDTYLSDIADAIRAKLGTSIQYAPDDMAEAILSISGGGGSVDIVPFSSGTDEQIVAMIQAAHAGIIDLQQDGEWAVGDTRSITVGAFTDGAGTSHSQQTIDISISQFGDYNSCGSVMQFDFKDCLSSNIRMNGTATNIGGYGSSEMKTTTLPALVNALPTWLKDLLLEFSVLASAGSSSSTINTVTGNKLALRSEVEIIGSDSYSVSGEGSQIAYYQTAANKIKKAGHSGSAGNWWLRSPYKSNNKSFCYINSYGINNNYDANSAYFGIAPFGCL